MTVAVEMNVKYHSVGMGYVDYTVELDFEDIDAAVEGAEDMIVGLTDIALMDGAIEETFVYDWYYVTEVDEE